MLSRPSKVLLGSALSATIPNPQPRLEISLVIILIPRHKPCRGIAVRDTEAKVDGGLAGDGVDDDVLLVGRIFAIARQVKSADQAAGQGSYVVPCWEWIDNVTDLLGLCGIGLSVSLLLEMLIIS